MPLRFTIFSLFLCFPFYLSAQTPNPPNTVGLLHNSPQASSGYTLLAPLRNTVTYLLDLDGQIVNQWNHTNRPGAVTYFLEDGTLLRTANTANVRFTAGGRGGRVEQYDWDGNVIWTFEYSDSTVALHHDIERLPNGNVLMIAWEHKSAEEAFAAGRDTTLLSEGELWPERIIEVEPTPPVGGNIVWQWHAWDHLVQDFDVTKENYGTVRDHPELIDLNYDPADGPADWLHFNAIDYHAELDQIILSVPRFAEVWVIDHSTTTEEAAGHTGGRYRRGGDLLYRWGNPRTYRRGASSPTRLFFQHDAQWIEPGLPGAGNLLIFNNGGGRQDGSYSSIDEVTPPLQADGTYALEAAQPFAPVDLTWRYAAPVRDDFFSNIISGTQRLPNGNTLICEGVEGRIFEVAPDGTIVWEYINPVTDQGPLTQGDEVPPGPVGLANLVFRSYRYAPDFPGLQGRTLQPLGTVELPTSSSSIANAELPEGFALEQNYPNPFNPNTTIRFTLPAPEVVSLTVYNPLGEQVVTLLDHQTMLDGSFSVPFDATHLSSGLYLYRLETTTYAATRRMVLMK